MTRPVWLLLLLALGCGAQPSALPPALDARLTRIGPMSAATAAMRGGLGHLYAGDLGAAGEAFNDGLALDPQHPHLNFLNAFVYHCEAEAGDASKAELALVGYELALRFDPHHWLAAFHLGRLRWQRREARAAQAAFAQAVVARPDHAPSAYGLAAASYTAGDPLTAAGALEQLPASARRRPAIRRAKAVVHAALGDQMRAQAELAAFTDADPVGAQQVSRRVQAWAQTHAQVTAPPRPAPAAKPPPTKPGPKMIMLDVVLISQETAMSSQRGVNLLSALSMQFGGTLLDVSRTTTTDVTTGAVTSFQDTGRSAMSISVPAITYSLNIANARDSYSEIVARPSVLAHDGEESEVFLGSELTYITNGQLGGQSYNKEVGITLRARPRFLGGDRIRLDVSTQFSSFAPTAAPGSFEQAVATVKNRSKANAELTLGQTLALAAGSRTTVSESDDGVPILRDIPIIQYLFSRSTRARNQAALVILVTPRRPPRLKAGVVENLGALRDETRAPEAVRALHRRHRDWFTPTNNSLVALDRLLGTDAQREFRRGDIQYAGIDGLPEPAGPDEADARPARWRRVVRDLLETLYF